MNSRELGRAVAAFEVAISNTWFERCTPKSPLELYRELRHVYVTNAKPHLVGNGKRGLVHMVDDVVRSLKEPLPARINKREFRRGMVSARREFEKLATEREKLLAQNRIAKLRSPVSKNPKSETCRALKKR